jgi:hypothetical protein
MAESEQTYKTHARWRPLFHFVVMPLLLLNVFVSLWRLYRLPGLGTAWNVVFAIAVLGVGFLTRSQAMTVQDRLIRLEMRLRLRSLLPPDLQPRINDLTHRQLVALRFASDAELPDLVREVLAGKLTTPNDIKMHVKNWQADWLRA